MAVVSLFMVVPVKVIVWKVLPYYYEKVQVVIDDRLSSMSILKHSSVSTVSSGGTSKAFGSLIEGSGSL